MKKPIITEHAELRRRERNIQSVDIYDAFYNPVKQLPVKKHRLKRIGKKVTVIIACTKKANYIVTTYPSK